jgi:hypothetical protein
MQIVMEDIRTLIFIICIGKEMQDFLSLFLANLIYMFALNFIKKCFNLSACWFYFWLKFFCVCENDVEALAYLRTPSYAPELQ